MTEELNIIELIGKTFKFLICLTDLDCSYNSDITDDDLVELTKLTKLNCYGCN